jgi:hypothetical protein
MNYDLLFRIAVDLGYIIAGIIIGLGIGKLAYR